MAGQRSRVCVLVSGGLDSTLLLYHLLAARSAATPVYVRCGLRWESVELTWLRRLLSFLKRSKYSHRLRPLTVLDLPLKRVYGSHWSMTGRGTPSAKTRDEAVYLPGRNVVLTSLAGIFCAQQGIGTLALGTLGGNPFGDASLAFFRRMSACLTQALGKPIRITAPLRRYDKAALIRKAGDAPLALSFSCIRPLGNRHCGRCNKCAERRTAFRRAGIADPTRYGHG